ncbi:dehydrodolichyl diphosphate synthase complex subunit nus1 [Sitophilus oryzae]|uniref:ditrans,polycis-polyprenyl diphosphate synthase [(2E,6E)-farnesyldiphosphate specific] n=1 Tax=Sitophilus oryzae TaxID=7048 RepID=A0A6J2YT61_SITOR|nr:dehydrodolichyl diphosphate synthase complex subunit nus1 [Sitophilus oryzae]
MFNSLFFKILYNIIHGIFTVLEGIFDLLERIIHGFVDFCHEFCTAHRINYLKCELEKGNKLPKHLTVLLVKEKPSYKDLSNIVLWCIKHHIIYLSFYDPTESLHQHKLEKELNGKLKPDDHVIWHNSSDITYRNGFSGRKVHVKILKQEDGRASVVNLTKSLSSTVRTKDISVEDIDRGLFKYFQFPDPELGLVCGKSLNFCAYPPWQMRLTEFLCIKSHYRLSYRTFLEQLYRYSKCEQRKGI